MHNSVFYNKVCHAKLETLRNVELLQKILKSLSNLDIERLDDL
jgi:hypothetical protein